MVLLWLSISLPSPAQQLLSERILSWPATQKGFMATGLLRVQPDSLRLLGNFQPGSPASAQLLTRISLRRVLPTTCDTLPVQGSAFQAQAVSPGASTGLVTRAGRVLVSNWEMAYRFSPIGLRLLTRSGPLRWQQTLPSPVTITTAYVTGLLEAPDRGFFVAMNTSERTYLVRLDSLGNTLWQKVICRKGIATFPPCLYDPVYARSGNLLFHCVYSAYSANTTGILEVSQNGDSLAVHPTSPNPLQLSRYITPGLAPLIPLRNGGFLVVADVDSANTSYSRPFLTRLDANLNVVWSSIYRQQASQQYVFSHPYELADGSLVVLANPVNGYPTTYYLFRYSASGVLLQRYAFTSPLIASFSNTGFTPPVGLQPLSDSTFMLVSNLRSSVTNGQPVARTYLAHLKVSGLRRVLDSHYIPAANSPLAARVPAAFPAPAHPNPAAETVTVPLPVLSASARLRLLDLAGRPVRAWPAAAGAASVTLPVGTVAPGLYLLTLEVPGQPPATQRLAVAH